MNINDLSGVADPVPHTALAAARDEARRSRRGLIDVLDEQLRLTPGEFVSTLAVTFRYGALLAHELAALTPMFDLVSYSECVTRRCVAARAPSGELVLALVDPFDTDLQEWANERLKQRFVCAVAYGAELAASLQVRRNNARAG